MIADGSSTTHNGVKKSPREIDHPEPEIDKGKLLIKNIDKGVSTILLIGLFYLICRIKYISFGVYNYQDKCVVNDSSSCKSTNCTELLLDTKSDATEILTIHWIFLVCLMLKGLYLTNFKIQEVDKKYGPYCMIFNAFMFTIILVIAFTADNVAYYLPGMFIGAVFIVICLHFFFFKINKTFYIKPEKTEFNKILFITSTFLAAVIMIITTTLTYIVYWIIVDSKTEEEFKVRQKTLYVSINFFICLISIMFHIVDFIISKPEINNTKKSKIDTSYVFFKTLTSSIIYALTMIFSYITYYIGVAFLFATFFAGIIKINIKNDQQDDNGIDHEI